MKQPDKRQRQRSMHVGRLYSVGSSVHFRWDQICIHEFYINQLLLLICLPLQTRLFEKWKTVNSKKSAVVVVQIRDVLQNSPDCSQMIGYFRPMPFIIGSNDKI
jgi:hypothetical protein